MEGRAVSELRLYVRRDTFLESADCPWVLLDDKGQIQSSGTQLADLPKSRRCRLVLASDLVVTLQTALPDLPERRLAPLLPAAAEAATLLEADAIHAVVLDHPKGGMATLAVTENAWLGNVLAGLASHGLHPNSALPEYLLLPQAEGQWSVCWRSKHPMARFNKHEGMTLDDGDPPVSLGLALHQRERPGALQIYLGDDTGAPALGQWRAAYGINAELAGSWDWRTAEWPELPGLLQGKYAPGLKRMDLTQFARPLAWGVASLAAIQLVGVVLDWAMLSREQSGIQHEMHVLAEEALPANSAIVDPAWQVTERLQRMRAATGIATAGDTLTGLLGKLGLGWPRFSGMLIQSLNYERGTLNATISNADPAWFGQLQTFASAQGLTASSQKPKDDGEGMVLTIQSAARGGSQNGQ
jgi:type II secretion system protein L